MDLDRKAKLREYSADLRHNAARDGALADAKAFGKIEYGDGSRRLDKAREDVVASGL